MFLRKCLLIPPILLFLTACGEGGNTPNEATTNASLENITRTAFSEAFRHLDDQGYVAEMTYIEERGNSPATEKRFLVRVETGEIQRIDGPKGDSDDPELQLRDPLPHLLPEDPPYLDPRTREFYSIETTPGRQGETHVVAELTPESERDLSIRRLEARLVNEVPTQLRLLRATESLLLKETERASVQLVRTGGAWVPLRVQLETVIDLPGQSPVSVQQQWEVLEVGGVPLEQ